MIATDKGHKNIVSMLLNAKADVNAKNQYFNCLMKSFGSTSLMIATENGHKDIIAALINSNADVNAKNQYY